MIPAAKTWAGQIRAARHTCFPHRTCWTIRSPSPKWSEQLRFRVIEVEPSLPVPALQDHDLAIVNGCDIGAGVRGQERERVSRVVGHGTPQAGKAKPVIAGFGELPFRLRRLGARELEEVRGRHQATSLREASPFAAEVDDRRSLGPRRRKSPAQLGELDPPLHLPDHRCRFGGPDILARRQVGCGIGKPDGDACLTECLQIGAVGDVIAIIIAHGRTGDL